jgi:hypothetical protein
MDILALPGVRGLLEDLTVTPSSTWVSHGGYSSLILWGVARVPVRALKYNQLTKGTGNVYDEVIAVIYLSRSEALSDVPACHLRLLLILQRRGHGVQNNWLCGRNERELWLLYTALAQPGE